jgi:hypothetical protein
MQQYKCKSLFDYLRNSANFKKNMKKHCRLSGFSVKIQSGSKAISSQFISYVRTPGGSQEIRQHNGSKAQ